MTRKDYSTIQRSLGHIEGVLACFDDDYGALDCISIIDSILDKEELTDELPDDAGSEVPPHFRNLKYTEEEAGKE